MATIKYAGLVLPLKYGESVLDCLLRHGIYISHSCKSGICHSCLMKADNGRIPARAQEGLRDTLRLQRCFLACACHPEEDLSVVAIGDEHRVKAFISGLDKLSDSVIRVRLQPSQKLDYKAGQFISLIRTNGLARSYSLASLPDEPEIELHVRRIPSGAMSEWLHTEAEPNTAMFLQGPSGNCFYVPGDPTQQIILAGAGTGLAPLYGIVRDALRNRHRAPIWLFHGALNANGLYLVEELKALALHHSNLHYVPTVLHGSVDDGVMVGPIDECITLTVPDLKNCRGYICGDPAFVNSLRMKLFLSGMASRAIYADAFVPSAAAAQVVGTGDSVR